MSKKTGSPLYDVIVVGAGNIGLAVARELAENNTVLVVDKQESGKGAGWASAGMIRPMTEDNGDDKFLIECLQSTNLYPQYITTLEQETDINIEYNNTGSILVAYSLDDMKQLERKWKKAREKGVNAQLLPPSLVREKEENLNHHIVGALHMPCDVHINNRHLLEALKKSCEQKGVVFKEQTEVKEVEKNAVTIDSEKIRTKKVIVCAGAWSGELLNTSIKPIKGHMLRVSGCAQPTHLISHGSLYLVPREDGSIVIGSNEEDVGFNSEINQDTIHELYKKAGEIYPPLKEAKITETWIGFRPYRQEEKPLIEKDGQGIYVATGHYRNGILLTPLTAKKIKDLIKQENEIIC